MSLYDFFFPEEAQASHLRSIAENQKRQSRDSRSRQRSADRRIDELENDVGYLALILGAILEKVDEKGLVSRDEIKQTISELDSIDGVKDGKLDVSILRGMGR